MGLNHRNKSSMSKLERSEPEVAQDAAWTRARSLNTTEATKYSEWVLLGSDLEHALRRATLWRSMAQAAARDTCDSEISASLFRDTVVSFIACFDDASPVYLDPVGVYGRTPGGEDYFQWLKNLRNTWVAHRGGPERQCVVAVVIDDSTGDVHGFGHLYHSYVGPKAEAGDDLVRMIEIALAHAQRQQNECASVVKDYIEKMTERERLSLPIANTIVPSHKEIHMGRRKFYNIKKSQKRMRHS